VFNWLSIGRETPFYIFLRRVVKVRLQKFANKKRFLQAAKNYFCAHKSALGIIVL
jgi:hypothetical protein